MQYTKFCKKMERSSWELHATSEQEMAETTAADATRVIAAWYALIRVKGQTLASLQNALSTDPNLIETLKEAAANGLQIDRDHLQHSMATYLGIEQVADSDTQLSDAQTVTTLTNNAEIFRHFIDSALILMNQADKQESRQNALKDYGRAALQRLLFKLIPNEEQRQNYDEQHLLHLDRCHAALERYLLAEVGTDLYRSQGRFQETAIVLKANVVTTSTYVHRLLVKWLLTLLPKYSDDPFLEDLCITHRNLNLDKYLPNNSRELQIHEHPPPPGNPFPEVNFSHS